MSRHPVDALQTEPDDTFLSIIRVVDYETDSLDPARPAVMAAVKQIQAVSILWLGPTGLFLASPMHSRWKLTSIRRCSGGITEPSSNNLLVFMLKIARHREASRV